MLRDLIIRDILIVERLDLEFQPGLNVLTGETGAGKSILLDCLGFVLGRRGPSDIVREGASSGEVTAIFEVAKTGPIAQLLEHFDLPADDDLIIRRVLTGGRKKSFVNDRPVGTEALRVLGDALLEIHGQHDDKGLLDTRTHVEYLDEFADAGAARGRVAQAWEAWRAALRDLEEAEAAHAAAVADADFVAHALTEMDELDPQVGDDAALDGERRLLKAAAAIRDDIKAAQGAVAGDAALSQVLEALRRLGKVAEQAEGRLDGAIERLERAANELGEADAEISATLTSLSGDPFRLEAVEDRLFGLRALARKHGVQSDELAALHTKFRAQHDAVSGGDASLEPYREKAAAAQAGYDNAASDLSSMRHGAAARLDAQVMGELQALKMERAQFATKIQPGEPGVLGIDRVGFEVATNPGSPGGPLAKIASGGELSRFLLALKVCLKGAGARTMIFDEIDRGVGGATADAVGRRLADIAAQDQVIVVTHSPQVAARGGHHWRVAKQVAGDITRSEVVPLDDDARIDELARMLAGETISDEAKSAAKVLLAG